MPRFSTAEYTAAANTLRGLSIDIVQKANSGHPGMPMGMADVAAVLWLKHLNTTAANPLWPNRDRFVLSCGHGSALLYSLLHLAGHPISMDDLKSFRQLGSITPGHPEFGRTPGVETTTGPLGQGFANAVGMAIAQHMMAARFNTADETWFDNYTYAFCGDGDMMEGISHEAASLAGHLKLGRLVAFYDANEISIEGSTDVTFTEDVAARFKAYGWKVVATDGHDVDQIDKAIRKAKRNLDAPTLVVCRTVIGKGSPNKAGSAKSHGEPLGADEVKLTKQALGLPEADFHVPESVYALFERRNAATRRLSTRWTRLHKGAMQTSPEFAARWKAYFEPEFPETLEAALPAFEKAAATRAASGVVIQALAKALPCFVGGSADLAPSNKSWIDGAAAVQPGDFSGRNFQFGVREHAMAAIQNGMLYYGGLRPFTATFFVFSDYLRPAIRVAAISHLPAVYVFTHDSFYVGEDGPTHEPVEHIASLRAMPNMTVIRPADPTETGAAWLAALRNTTGPTAILLTRQNLPVIDRATHPAAAMLAKGAYTLSQTGDGTPDLIILASGSEVSLAMKAAEQLADVNVRIVNMPSWELFEKQPRAYRDSVIDPACASRLVIEAASSFGWAKYAGDRGAYVTLDRYGDSAPCADLEKAFGFTVDNVVAKARELLG
jgi:transketolase